MDITPHVELLRALRQQRLKWSILISELVDNSFDAGASRVEIQVGPRKQVVVTDDGTGCGDIAAMLTLGGRQSHATTKLGRYGIGLKDAALYLWGVTNIETVHRGELRRISVEWSKVEGRDGKWIVPDATVEDAGARIGTKIEFSKIDKNLPVTRPGEKSIVDELGWIFAPALLSGKQIVIKSNRRVTCAPYQLPPLTDIVEATFAIDGRGVRIRAGIVADGQPNSRPGFTLQHGHRSIKSTALGSNGMSTSRVAGIVELDSQWALSKNKDDITELSDELGEAIFARCESMLRKADTQARSLESSALSAAVSERLTAALQSLAAANRRERRDKPEVSQAGTVTPKATERRRRRAAKVHDIEGAIARAAKSGVRLDWSDSIEAIGQADLLGNRVTLNSSLPLLKRLRVEENADAIAIIAFGVYVDGVRESPTPQRYLAGIEPGNFLEDWGTVLSSMPGAESTPKVKVSA